MATQHKKRLPREGLLPRRFLTSFRPNPPTCIFLDADTMTVVPEMTFGTE